jgi:WD40 repeat protein
MAMSGRWLATSSFDGTLRLWDLGSGRMERSLLGHTAPPDHLAFSPSGHFLASGGHDRFVRVWPIAESAGRVLGAHDGEGSALKISPAGLVVSGGGDRAVRVWPTDGGTADVLWAHAGKVHALAVDPTGRLLASAGVDGRVMLWPLEVPGGLERFDGGIEVGRHASRVTRVAFSPDGSRLYSAGDDGLGTWELAARQGRVEAAPGGPVVSVTSAPTGALAFGALDGTVSLSTLAGRTSFRAHAELAQGLSFSRDGQRLITGGWDGDVCAWDARTGSPLARWHFEGARVRRVSFADGDRRAVAVSQRGEVWWFRDLTPGAAPVALPLHRDTVRDLAVSADGRLAITGGFDGLLGVWDTELGRLLDVQVADGPVEEVALSADGRWFASASYEGTIAVWPVRREALPGDPQALHAWLGQLTSATIRAGQVASPWP